MNNFYYSLGLMSGTSGDGVDASLIYTNGKNDFEVISDTYEEYPADIYRDYHSLKPKILNKRRYYSPQQVEICKLIKFLTKDKKMTIKGVKNVLNTNINKLDDYNLNSLKADYFKKNIKIKSVKILKKLDQLKKYGKKNSH